jgi:hypothetical protein
LGVIVVEEVAVLARASSWHSPRARVARCLFCGNVGVWWDCRCSLARLIEAGKLPRPRTISEPNGKLTIECCPELLAAARRAGVIRIAETEPPLPETEPPSRETEPPLAETEPPLPKLSHQTEPLEETEPPSDLETEPPRAREQKRLRIVARILLDPAASDRVVSAAVGVSRNTVAAVRASMREAGE